MDKRNDDIMVSVIVPVYNVERYLGQCVDSILAQRCGIMPPIEVILVDDGSTDRSADICRRYAASHEGVRVISRYNGGPSVARNDGIAAARGRWLMFVDSDDVLAPGALPLLLKLAHENADADMITGAMLTFNDVVPEVLLCENENLSETAIRAPLRTLSGTQAAMTMLYQTGDAWGLTVSAWGKLFNRRLWGESRFTEGILYEDIDLIPRLVATASKVIAVKQCVYLYRIRPESILGTFRPQRYDVIDVCERLERYFTPGVDVSSAKNSTDDIGVSDDKAMENLGRAASDRLMSAAFNMLLMQGAYQVDDPQMRSRLEAIIRSHRAATLFNSQARRRNRVGALLSYIIGTRPFSTPLFGRLFLRRR